MNVLVYHGNEWCYDKQTGIFRRDMYSGEVPLDYVASSNMKNSQIIRLGRMSTKMQGLFATMVGGGLPTPG